MRMASIQVMTPDIVIPEYTSTFIRRAAIIKFPDPK